MKHDISLRKSRGKKTTTTKKLLSFSPKCTIKEVSVSFHENNACKYTKPRLFKVTTLYFICGFQKSSLT